MKAPSTQLTVGYATKGKSIIKTERTPGDDEHVGMALAQRQLRAQRQRSPLLLAASLQIPRLLSQLAFLQPIANNIIR